MRDNYIPVRSVKFTPSRLSGRATDYLSLKALNYRGLSLKAKKHPRDQIFDTTITFNPGVCLHGHNGRIITLTEFLHALALLVTHLKPLLRDARKWVDLIPGLRRNGVAYWHYLEIPHHVIDHTGAIMKQLHNAGHKTLKKFRSWETSHQMGSRKGQYQLAIYNKANEMIAHNKLDKLSNQGSQRSQVRFELRLKSDKLISVVGNSSNVEVIDGNPRLVRFLSAELVEAHRKCFGDLNGFYASQEQMPNRESIRPDAALGVALARLTTNSSCKLGFPELCRLLQFYRPAKDRALAKVRKEGYAELLRLSQIKRADILSDDSYAMSYSVTNPALEKKISYPLEDFHVLHEIRANYCPADLRYHPITSFPHYFQL